VASASASLLSFLSCPGCLGSSSSWSSKQRLVIDVSGHGSREAGGEGSGRVEGQQVAL
jgi:hypothetical protein